MDYYESEYHESLLNFIKLVPILSQTRPAILSMLTFIDLKVPSALGHLTNVLKDIDWAKIKIMELEIIKVSIKTQLKSYTRRINRQTEESIPSSQEIKDFNRLFI